MTGTIAVILPVTVYMSLPDSWIKFFAVCSVCVISTLLTVFYVGLSKVERDFIKTKLKVGHKWVKIYLKYIIASVVEFVQPAARRRLSR